MIVQSAKESSRGTSTLPTVIAEHAAHRPDAIALVCGERETNYATLHRASCQIAHTLLAEGLKSGDRIGYLGRDSERFYELLIGAANTSVVLVPINWRLTVSEISHILEDSGLQLLFVDASCESVAENAVRELPWDIRLMRIDRGGAAGAGYAERNAVQRDTPPDHPDSPLDPLLQMYTSGDDWQVQGRRHRPAEPVRCSQRPARIGVEMARGTGGRCIARPHPRLPHRRIGLGGTGSHRRHYHRHTARVHPRPSAGGDPHPRHHGDLRGTGHAGAHPSRTRRGRRGFRKAPPDRLRRFSHSRGHASAMHGEVRLRFSAVLRDD